MLRGWARGKRERERAAREWERAVRSTARIARLSSPITRIEGNLGTHCPRLRGEGPASRKNGQASARAAFACCDASTALSGGLATCIPYAACMEFVILPLLAACVAAVTLLSGFGLGTVVMPVFALFFPLEVAVAATAVVHLSNNLLKLALVGKWADKATVLRFGVPAVIAALIGAALLAWLAPAPPLHTYTLAGRSANITLPKLIIAGVLVTFAVLELTPRFQRQQFPTKFMPLGGALSGFFGGLTGMQGALRAPFLLRAGLTKDQFVGTTNVVSTAVDIVRLAVYVAGFTYLTNAHDYHALTSPRLLLLVALTALAGCIGSAIGKRVLQGITMTSVRAIVAAMLFIVAILLATGVA